METLKNGFFIYKYYKLLVIIFQSGMIALTSTKKWHVIDLSPGMQDFTPYDEMP